MNKVLKSRSKKMNTKNNTVSRIVDFPKKTKTY